MATKYANRPKTLYIDRQSPNKVELDDDIFNVVIDAQLCHNGATVHLVNVGTTNKTVRSAANATIEGTACLDLPRDESVIMQYMSGCWVIL